MKPDSVKIGLIRRRVLEDSDNEDSRMNEHSLEEIEHVNLQDKRQMTVAGTLARLVLAMLIGIVFGFSLEKARVFEPTVIRSQMALKNFILLKFLLSAVATGLLCFSLLAMGTSMLGAFHLATGQFFNQLSSKGVLAMLLGGCLMGAGITLAGSDPNMVMIQLGAKTPGAVYTFGGVLFGSLLYGLGQPLVDIAIHSKRVSATNPFSYRDAPFFIMSLPLVAMLGMVVFAMEILVPWKKVPDQARYDWFHWKSWPPYVSGILIGCLQVPSVLFLYAPLGSSTGYITMVAQPFIGPAKKLSPYLAKSRTGFVHWWHVLFICGTLLGSYISASASEGLATSKGVSESHAFLGGLVMILGAHIAGGCSSGHGMTGMGLLSILSFVATTSMFIGGMVTAYLLKSSKNFL